MEEEYLDPLVSWDVADKCRDIGFGSYCTESFVRTDNDEIDSQYTGLIPDQYTFECYRPSLGQLRSWISRRYAVELSLEPYTNNKNNQRVVHWGVKVLTGNTLQNTTHLYDYKSFDLALDNGLHSAIKWIIKTRKHV